MNRFFASGMMCLLLFTAPVSAATVADVLGYETVRSIAKEELGKVTLPVTAEAVDWVVHAIRDVEVQNYSSRTETERAIREGLYSFARAVEEYAMTQNEDRITQQVCEVFVEEAATCGMIPCSQDCCELCNPCN